MRIVFFSVVIIFLSPLVFQNCTKEKPDSFERIMKSKKILIGTDATYPPFESKDTETGKLVGFDIDLMNAICEKMGVQPEYIIVPFDGIISGLKNNKYDVVISSFTITPARGKEIDFSKPYYQAGQSIAVREDEEKINSIADLIGEKIGVQLGTTGELLAKTVKDADIISYDNIGAAFIDLENRKLDAIINDKPTSERIIALRGKAKIVGPTLSSENYGIAVRKGEKSILEAVNNNLDALEVSGKIENIKKKWFSVETRIK